MRQLLSHFWDFYKGRGCIGKGLIIMAALTVLLFACAGLGALLPSPPATPTPQATVRPEPTATILPRDTPVPTNTFVPTDAPAPTSTPAPTSLPDWWEPGVGALPEINRSQMTELQFADWLSALRGQRFHVQGAIAQVEADGDVRLKMTHRVIGMMYLEGIPLEVTRGFQKNERLEAYCTVRDHLDLLGVTIFCQDVFLFPR